MFQVKWLWQNMKGYRAMYVTGLILTVVCNILVLANPIIGQQIVDIFIKNDNAIQNLQEKRNLLILLCVGMVAFTLFRTLLQYGTNLCYEKSSQGLIFSLRTQLYDNIQNQDMKYYDSSRTGDLMTRMTGDLDMIRHSTAWIVKTMLESISLFTVAMVYFLSMDVLMTLILIAITPFIFIVTRHFSKSVRPKYIDLRERLSNLNSNAQENIAANRVVKAFAREQYEIEKFDRTNKDYSTANKEAAFVWLKYQPFVETSAQALWVIHMVAGGIFVINGRITFGEYGAFSALLWTISNPIRRIGMLINDMQRFFASVTKVIEVYFAKPSIVNEHNEIDKRRYSGKIEFKNVSFKYDNTEVLKDISFTVEPGETIAIMGGTGAGKTTLVNLIPRFYDTSRGEVLADGINVKKLELDELRSNIGMATQDVLLFSDTIDGNIAYGDIDLPEDDVKEFASLASADFIEKMPKGYQTIIGERGVGISGGQKQRIALARAMAIRPAILILDDTTSAVDLETELYIQNSLKNLDFECTKFIIAQRVSATQHADKIIILEDGEILEMGSHKELIAKKGYYYEIFKLQNDGIA